MVAVILAERRLDDGKTIRFERWAAAGCGVGFVEARGAGDQADAGKIPCLKAGNRYLFNPLAVQDALAAKAARTRQGGDDAQ